MPGRAVVTAGRDRAEAVLADVLTTAAPDLLRYLEARLGADDAPDALSDVLLAAWRRAADLPTSGDEARAWLFGVARNVVLNSRRGRARRTGLVVRLRGHAPREDAPAADRGVEVRDAIERLDPDLAELVRLLHWDGLTLAEAARVLDQPATTTASRYRRAREQLRAALAGPDLAGPGAAGAQEPRDPRPPSDLPDLPEPPRLLRAVAGPTG